MERKNRRKKIARGFFSLLFPPPQNPYLDSIWIRSAIRSGWTRVGSLWHTYPRRTSLLRCHTCIYAGSSALILLVSTSINPFKLKIVTHNTYVGIAIHTVNHITCIEYIEPLCRLRRKSVIKSVWVLLAGKSESFW